MNKAKTKKTIQQHLMKQFTVAIFLIFIITFLVSIIPFYQSSLQSLNYGYFYLFVIPQAVAPLISILAAYVILPAKLKDRYFWVTLLSLIGFIIYAIIDNLGLQIGFRTNYEYTEQDWLIFAAARILIALFLMAIYFFYIYKLTQKSTKE